MKRVLRSLVCAGALILATVTLTLAQGATAQLSGIVKDPSGGVLPGASVNITQTDTGFKRETVSDAEGAFSFPAIPIGPYRLEVMLQGFSAFVQTGIVLQVNSNPVVPVTMKLGTVAETVTVVSNTTLVETRTLGVSQVMDNNRIMALPLNGRNPADLLATLPAAVPQGGSSSRSMQGSSGGQAYSLAGGLSFGVSFTLDGATHNNPYDNLNLPLPFPDALQEFRAETSALTAQNGMHSGGAVNAVTKSGTNAFRGDAFEFFRHHAMNSTDPFAAKDANGNPKDDGLKRNQYGATVGGPIKTDRIFFFGGYQGTNTRVVPVDNKAFVPTAAMLAGDFTAYASPACNNGTQVNLRSVGNQLFVNNRIDPSLLSPAALNIAKRLPTTTDPCGLITYGRPSSTDEGQGVAKIDYQMSAKHSLFGRYVGTKQFTPPPFSLDAAQGNVLVTSIGGRDNLAQSFTAGENWVLTPTTFNAVRFAFNRLSIHRTSTDFFSAPEEGVKIYSYLPHYMLLSVAPNGFSLGGGTESTSDFTTNEFQISDDVTLVRGQHQFAFGGSVARWTSLSLANVRSPGQLAVDANKTGLALADFLLGRLADTNGLQQAAPNTLDMSERYLGLYGQDTWRLGSRLTLNLGLRWEPFFPQQLENGAVYQFDMTRFQQNVHSTVFVNAPAGLYFPGDPGFPTKAGMLTQWDNLGPRVGIAWDLSGDGRSSLRASYGKSFEFVNGQFHLNTSVAPPWGSEIRLNNPPGGLDDPFLGSPGGATNIFPLPAELTSTTPFSLNGPYLSLNNDLKSTRVHLWNVTYERQLGRNWLATAGYVGSRTNNIWESTPLNNGLFVTVNGAAPSAANLNARRPFTLADPNNGKYYGFVDMYVSDGSQRYKGMILSIRGNGRYGSNVAANYALSNCYGSPDGNGGGTTNVSVGYNKPSDPHYDDGNCAADRLHNFSLSASVESPRFERAALRAALSSWRFAGSFRATSGSWLNITTGVDRALNGQTGTQRVDVVSGVDPFADHSINPANGFIRFLNPDAFAQPALGSFGNIARNSIRGPGFKNFDFALSRNFRVQGSRNIEVRWEAFNAFDWFNWGNPSTSRNSATFGQISTNAGQPRVMQLAVKYVF